ncbi:beta-lactamase/transpeptidase-like protein, partial [Catenaria anguillulae PL171]
MPAARNAHASPPRTLLQSRLGPMFLCSLLVILTSSLLPLLVHAGGSTDKLTGLSSKSIAAFVESFAAKHVPSRVPGISVAVVKDGKTLYSGGAGQADQSSSRDVGATTPMRVGSLAQLVTLIAVLQQKDAQRLSLTDPIDSFLPVGSIPSPAASVGIPGQVSIRDALAHAGGWEAKSMGLWAPKTKMPANASIAMNEFPRRVRPQGSAPLAYSPHAYDLVEYLHDQVMGPLGMNVGSTASVRGHELSGSDADTAVAMGYSATRGSGYVPVDVYGTSPATSGLCASAADMAQVLKVFTNEGKVNGNQVLAKDSVAECLTPQVSGYPGVSLEDGAGATLGWFEHPVGAVKALVHPGDAPGFASLAAVFPDEGWAYFLLLMPTRRGQARVLDRVYQGIFNGASGASDDGEDGGKSKKNKNKKKSKASSSSGGSISGVDLSPYVGHYKPVQSSHTMFEAAAHVLAQIRVTLSPSGNSLLVSRVNAAELTTGDIIDKLAKATTTLGGGPANSAAISSGTIELVPVRATSVSAKEPGQRGGQAIVFRATTPAGDTFTAAVYPGGTEVNAPAWYLTTNALGHGYLASFQPIGYFESASFVLPTMTYGLGIMAAYMVIWLVKGL